MRIRSILSTVVLLFWACSCSAPLNTTTEGTINPENKRDWKLVWNDEFNYKTRDQLLKVWEADNGPTSHTLCSRWKENVEVGGGTVRLVNHKENRGGQEWTSASITSYDSFLYGYFECRYKYAAATGTNNSFWIMARNNKIVPPEGRPFELDINEGHYPSEYTNCIHDWTEGNHTSNGDHVKYPGIDFSKEYHIFSVEWSEDEIVFYIDRKEFRREKNDFCKSPAPVRLSEAILSWGGPVTDAIDGTFMEVDYVRIYKRR